MAIAFVAMNEGTPTAALSSTSTVTKPTGLAVDDVMIGYTVSNLNGATAPNGRWVQVLSQDSNQSSLFRVTVWYCVATSADVAASNFVFHDSDSSSPMWAAIAAYRGVDTASPIDAFDSTPNSGSSASHTTPAITTTHSSMVLSHNAVRRNSTSAVTFTSGVAHERFEGGNHDAVGYWAAMYDSGAETAAGSISGVSITASTTSSVTDSIVTTVALKTLNVAVNASAGVAAATASASASAPTLTESPTAGLAALAVVASSPTVGVGVVAGFATATVSVKTVTVSTTPFTNASAGCAQVVASVKQTRMDYAPAGKASSTVVVNHAFTSIGNQADTAQVLAIAQSPAIGFGVSAGVAQAVGSGSLAGPGLGSVVGVAQAYASAGLRGLYFGSTRTILVGAENRLSNVEAEDRTLMVEES